MQRLNRRNQRGDKMVRSGLSKDDAIVFWIRLQLCGVVDFLQDSVVSQS